MPLSAAELREGERILKAGRGLADTIEAIRVDELNKGRKVRDAMERRLAVKLSAIWLADNRIWRKIPGGEEVLDMTQQKLLKSKRRKSLDLIESEYAKQERGLLPRIARA